MAFSLKKTLSNVFQISTLKAVTGVAACFGVTIPEPVIQGLSWAYISINGLYETFRDEKKT